MSLSHTTPKEWGTEHTVLNMPKYCHKRLIFQPGKMSSVHMHEKKHETFIVKEGHGILQLGGDTGGCQYYYLKPGVAIEILPKTFHRVMNASGAPLEIWEYSTNHSDEDVIRLTESGEIPTPQLRANL